MMMARFVLTLLVGLVVSLGALVSVGSGVASAGVLPDVSPEEQYRFSLGRALANDLVTAEAAFDEFRKVNKGHERSVDAAFWLGRVQFMRGEYEKAAMTFSEFNSTYPGDARLVDTTLWIAESVSHFAPAEQACEIYASLPKLLDKPPESFLTQLGALVSAAKCDETVIASSKHAPKQTRIQNQLANLNSSTICKTAIDSYTKTWSESVNYRIYVQEAKRRGLKCNVSSNNPFKGLTNNQVCVAASAGNPLHEAEAKRRGLNCGVTAIWQVAKVDYSKSADWVLCRHYENVPAANVEAKRRGLNCGVGETTQAASAPVPKAKPKVTSAALTAAEKEAERLRQELAALKAKQQQQQQTISSDTKLPTITIASASSNGPQGTVKGRVTDNTGIAEVRVDGKQIQTDRDGNFTANTYVPEGGVSVSIQAVDLAGLSSSMSVRLDRAAVQTAAFRFDRLNPLGRKVATNKDAVAIIVGVSDYKETTARAAYADSDAKVFQDYAIEKLGVPRDRI
ncbi:hypothetical protein N8783_06225, partial [Alphaproteobacteria bacterium]|nr:hypothetical protein [Alphaproteobacteria bacterium]